MNWKRTVFSSVAIGMLCWGAAACGALAQEVVLDISKSADPTTVWPKDCDEMTDTSRVSLSFQTAEDCSAYGHPVDVMLVLDKTGSMVDVMDELKEAAKAFVDMMRPTDRAGLVAFNSEAQLQLGLTDMTDPNKSFLKGAIDLLFPQGSTNIGDGIRVANRALRRGRSGIPRIEVLFTDGEPNEPDGVDPFEYARSGATQAADVGIQIYTIGFGVGGTAAEELLQDIAIITGGEYYSATDPNMLQQLFETIASELLCVTGRDYAVTEVLREGVNLEDNFTIDPDDVSTGPDGTTRLYWFIGELSVGETWEVAFDISFDEPGTLRPVDVEGESRVTYTGVSGHVEVPFPQAYVTVNPCTPELDAFKDDVLYRDVDGDGVPSPGDTLRYDVSIRNIGPLSAADVLFSDTLDRNVSLVVGSVASSHGTILAGNTPGDTTVQIDVGTLVGGDTADVEFLFVISKPLPVGVTEVSNQGVVTGFELAPELTDDPETDTDDDPTVTPVTARTVIDAEKEDTDLNGGSTVPGDTIEYVVSISNAGNQDAENLQFTDVRPAHTHGLTVTEIPAGAVDSSTGDEVDVRDIDLLGGGSVTVRFRVVVDDVTAADVEEVSNQGIVSEIPDAPDEPTDDPDTPAPNDSTDTPLAVGPVIEVEKTDSDLNDGDVVPGDVIEYVVTISNVGTQDATGLRFTDAIPEHTHGLLVVFTPDGASDHSTETMVDIQDIAVPVDDSVEVVFQVTVDDVVPEGVTEISNQGFVRNIPSAPDEPTDDPDTPDPDDPTVTPLVAGPEIRVKKVDTVVGDGDFVVPTGTIEYTVTIANIGSQSVSDLDFADGIPQYTEYVDGSLSTTCGGTPIAGADSVRVDGFSIPARDSCTVIFQVRVDGSIPPGVTEILNQAIIRNIPNQGEKLSDDPDTPEPGDPTATPLRSLPVISVEKVDEVIDGAPYAVPGATIQYTVTIQNIGNQDAVGLDFVDTVPAHTSYVSGTLNSSCDGTLDDSGDPLRVVGFSLPVSHSCTVTFQVRVDDSVPAGVDVISNQGFVQNIPEVGEQPSDDPQTPEENDPTETPLRTGVIIEVEKVDNDVNGTPLFPGEDVEYTIVIYNEGYETASGLAFEDSIPDYTTYVDGSLSQTCGGTIESTDPISITGISVGPGTSCTITFRVRLDDEIPEDLTEISNQGYVCNIPGEEECEPTDDPETPEPDDPTETPVEWLPGWDVEVYKVATSVYGGDLFPGDVIEYEVTMENHTDEDVFDLVFDDPIPEYTLALMIVSIPGGAHDESSSDVVRVTGIDIPGGGSVHIVFRVTVDLEVPESVTTISNQGVVHDISGENEEPSDDPGTPEDDDPTVLQLSHGMVILDPIIEAILVAHDTNGDELFGGDVIEYTVTLFNLGPHETNNLIFYCPIPEHTENLVVSGVPSGAVDISLPELVVISRIGLDVGGMANITFSVQVVLIPPEGATEISCQGYVSNIPFMEDELTDDPETLADHDPTVLALDTSMKKCDVNGDGGVHLDDLFLQLRHVVHDVELVGDQLWTADYNDDGSINLLDLMGCIREALHSVSSKGAAHVMLFSPDVLADRGTTATLPVYLESNAPVAGAFLRLGYDRTLIAPQAAVLTERSAGMVVAQNSVGGHLYLLLYSETGETIPAGDGPILEVPFEVSRDVSDETEITLDETVLFTPEAHAVVLHVPPVTVTVTPHVPEGHDLLQNYPNPFNPRTTIEYQLPHAGDVRLIVYNLLGEEVRTLVSGAQEAGYCTVTWDGKDDSEKKVSSGIYLYRLRAGDYTATKKMTLVK